MIAFLVGMIEHHTENSLLINVQGVGYEVFVPTRLFIDFPINKTQKVFTYHKVAEDAHTLFGFASLADVSVFKTLIGVSGIGAKTALQMLEFPAERIISSIESENIDELTRIPGLGKKTASRLILELKGKIVHSEKENPKSSEYQNVIDILKGLGFSPQKVEELFANLSEDKKYLSEEELVRWGLKNM